jgi:hypothetical protein
MFTVIVMVACTEGPGTTVVPSATVTFVQLMLKLAVIANKPGVANTTSPPKT